MICALVLAAGQSRRMGTQKLLLPLEGQPVIVHVVDELLRSPVDRVFVVVGEGGRQIREAMAGRRVHFVTNTDAEGEMLSSVRCGLTAMPAECDAALVALQHPLLGVELVALVVGDPTAQVGLRAHLATALGPARRPRRVIHVAQLPRSSSGKLQKEALERMAREENGR